MKRNSAGFALALALLIPAKVAFACAACGCMVSRDWQGQDVSTQPGWDVILSYDFINQNQLRQGKTNLGYAGAFSALGGAGNEVETQTATRITTVSLDYNGENWGVNMQMPYSDRYHTTFQTGDGAYNYSRATDLGDLRVTGKYTGFSADQSTGLIFGIKLATGATNTNFALGSVIDPSLQVGTGSNDLILGAFHVGQTGKLGWFAQATVQHAMDSTNGYRPGDATSINLGLRYAEFGQRVTPLLQLNLIHRQSDSGPGASYFTGGPNPGAPLTGGDLAYLAPGVSVRLGGGYSAYGYLQLPVYQDVNGVQLVPKYILSLGIKHIF